MSNTASAAVRANQSAEKLLVIMEYLSLQRDPVRLLDLSRELQINNSTALRFLTTLCDLGYAAKDKDTSRYYLTYKICGMANNIMERISLRDIAKPYIVQIFQLFDETVCLAIEKDFKAVYIEVIEGPNSMIRSMQRIGSVAPLHCTGVGKLLLLNYSDTDIDRLISVEGLRRFTDHTITTKWELQNELKSIRRKQFSFDNEECEISARCIAGPVYDVTGKVIAGISITGPAQRIIEKCTPERLAAFRAILQELSERMGYSGNSLRAAQAE